MLIVHFQKEAVMAEQKAKDPESAGVGEVDVRESTQIKVRDNTQIDLSTAEGVEAQTKRIEKYMEAQGRIRKACINMLNVHDLVDQDGKPYLMWTGTAKIASAFGVSYDTPRFTQEIVSDDKGEFINIQCETTVRYAGRSVPEIGSCSTHDQFFAQRSKWDAQTHKSEKYFLPLSEIDINDIKKKALTNALNRGLKSLLGMSFSWDEIAAATGNKITQSLCVQVRHGKGTQGGKTEAPQTADAKSKVWKMLLEMADGDTDLASKSLARLTTWKNRENKMVSGKTKIEDVSEAMMKHLVPAVEKEHYELFGKQAQGNEEAPPPPEPGQ